MTKRFHVSIYIGNVYSLRIPIPSYQNTSIFVLPSTTTGTKSHKISEEGREEEGGEGVREECGDGVGVCAGRPFDRGEGEGDGSGCDRAVLRRGNFVLCGS